MAPDRPRRCLVRHRVHLQVAVAAHRAELVVAATGDAARVGGAGDGTTWIV